MFELAETLAADHAEALDSLPKPLPPACIRSLIAASANDHRFAEAHRKSSQAQRTLRQVGRSARLIRSATIAEDRAAELLAEVR